MDTQDALSLYMHDIAHCPKLTADEEKELFARRDEPESRERLITANLPLVVHIAKRYTNIADMPELISAGNVALIHAVDTFDPDNGAAFSTYAGVCIMRGILNIRQGRQTEPLDDAVYLEAEDFTDTAVWRIMVHQALERLTEKERHAVEMYYGFYGAQKTLEEIGTLMGVTRQAVSFTLKRAQKKLREILE